MGLTQRSTGGSILTQAWLQGHIGAAQCRKEHHIQYFNRAQAAYRKLVGKDGGVGLWNAQVF